MYIETVCRNCSKPVFELYQNGDSFSVFFGSVLDIITERRYSVDE